MLGGGDQAIAQVAYTPHDICDTFPALDAMHRHGAEAVVIAMGNVGEWCRVLARKLGAFASYASLSRDAATAPGQLTVCDMVSQYRWPMIDEATRIFGVLGDPIKHSLSPLIFNRWFDDAGINAVYLPLLVAREGNCVHRFLDQCMERPFLNMEGFSVTLPHKHSAAIWVGDGADRPVKTIGAANTLVLGAGPPRASNPAPVSADTRRVAKRGAYSSSKSSQATSASS